MFRTLDWTVQHFDLSLFCSCNPGLHMGSAADYSCPSCGYMTDFMVSGDDVGESGHVHAVLCHTCRELRICRLSDGPSMFEQPSNHDESPPFKLVCPESEDHEVEPWSDPGPCPHCRATLVRGNWSICWD